jgi:hypothetical protein
MGFQKSSSEVGLSTAKRGLKSTIYDLNVRHKPPYFGELPMIFPMFSYVFPYVTDHVPMIFCDVPIMFPIF